MSDNEWVLLIITSAIGLLLVLIAIMFLFGKGLFLIAGYNTLSKSEKEKFDKKKLSRFMGFVTLPIGLLTPIVAIGGIYDLPWLIYLYVIIVIGLSVFAIWYANTIDRWKS